MASFRAVSNQMRNKSQAKSVLHLHARRMESAGLVLPSGKGGSFLSQALGSWAGKGFCKSRLCPKSYKLQCGAQVTTQRDLRLEVGKSKPCWSMVVKSSCVHHDGGALLTAWSARGPRACAVLDTRGSGSFVGITMI